MDNWIKATLVIGHDPDVPTFSGVGSLSPIELIGHDAGLALTSYGTELGSESYVTSFARPTADSPYYKMGSVAFQWTVQDASEGYASWNVHTSQLYTDEHGNVVQSDNYGLVCWALHGAAMYPHALGPEYAPGPGVFRVYGDTVDHSLVNITTHDQSKTLNMGIDTGIGYIMVESSQPLKIGCAGHYYLEMDVDGTITLPSLAGTSTRALLVDSTGKLVI